MIPYVTITTQRSAEILAALADYHGILQSPTVKTTLAMLVRTSEELTIKDFYAFFPQCVCPSRTILLCIIEELRSATRPAIR